MTDWRHRAKCLEVDPEIFFPERSASTKPARAVCATCPVATQCLAQALENGEMHGIWGGKTERERRAIARRPQGMNRPRHSPCVSCHKPTTLWSVFSGHCFECYRTRGEAA